MTSRAGITSVAAMREAARAGITSVAAMREAARAGITSGSRRCAAPRILAS